MRSQWNRGIWGLAAVAAAFTAPSADAMGGKKLPVPLAGTISADIRFVPGAAPESCQIAGVVEAPPGLLEADGRLIPDLRLAAKIADPFFSLRLAAKRLSEGDHELGRAYADLAVTGALSFSRFKLLHESGQLNRAQLTRESGAQAANEALDRAYRVAHALAFGGTAEREALGWIAVSAEDDYAYRPVNVSSSREFQHTLTFSVRGIPITTRFIVAEGLSTAPQAPAYVPGKLPVVPEPVLSANAKVLLFMHGMDSRLEEAEDLIRALRAISRRTGENWTIISFDLPTSGYATQVDHTRVSDIRELGHARVFPPGFDAGGRHKVPVLDFVEDSVIAFADALDARMPFKKQVVAAIGGSLGGNLAFRLGRRAGEPWLRSVVSWSPAAIWDSLADGADIFKQLGVATAWKRAGGAEKNLLENHRRRSQFFNLAFGGAIRIGGHAIMESQPDQWYSRNWPCFDAARTAARKDREEIYNREFRLWHWRLGAEQLIFTQQTEEAPHRPMLLMAGADDDFNFTGIYSATLKTARRMNRTPGRAIFFAQTGHSIHAERPEAMAEELTRFLTEVGARDRD